MAYYRINEQTVGSDEPEFEDALAQAYSQRQRPLCLCLSTGIEMYVARIGGRHFVKRMPNTGPIHDPGCESYEPPAELSGLGQVLGTAIEENVDDGSTNLKLGFSLSKGGSRARPTPSANEGDSVKSDGSKLTLRGTLHYLWEQAGFNRWSPGMESKRSWYVVRKFLLRAAKDKRAKGSELSELLFVPEEWRFDRKDKIEAERKALFAKITGAQSAGRPLMILIGEVKEISQSRYSHKLTIKHVPDVGFMLNEDIHRRMLKRFDLELALWDSCKDTHLLVIATFSINISGIVSVEEAALMNVNSDWIPIESTFDKELVDHLIAERRRFVKGLRYNLPNSRPLAAAVLADTSPNATALYVLPPGAEEDYVKAAEGLMADSLLTSWSWAAGEKSMPALPPKAPPARPEHSPGYQRAARPQSGKPVSSQRQTPPGPPAAGGDAAIFDQSSRNPIAEGAPESTVAAPATNTDAEAS